jgi:hypothetical protein
LKRALPALLVCIAACGGEVDSRGLQAWLRVPGGQFVAGPLPAPAGGPAVRVAALSAVSIVPGTLDQSVVTNIDLTGTSVLLGIQGDIGYWIVPAGSLDVQQPNQLKTQTPVQFSPQLPPGQFQLAVQAAAASGIVGVGRTIAFHTPDVAALGPGGLSFTLSWDTEADLDLHVVDPADKEIFWGRIAADDGVLDFDSNQSCIIDGRRRESVTWASAAPSGNYQVRVETSSLCSAATAHWTLIAQLGEAVVATVQGQSTHFDTLGAHGRGAGLLALQLVVP